MDGKRGLRVVQQLEPAQRALAASLARNTVHGVAPALRVAR